MFYCRKNTHYLKLNPVRGSLSVAVGDTESPTTPYGVAYRIQQYSDNPLKMNILRRFETAHGHPFFFYRDASPTGMSHPHHAGFFTLTFDHVCSTTETMISAMPRTNEKFSS